MPFGRVGGFYRIYAKGVLISTNNCRQCFSYNPVRKSYPAKIHRSIFFLKGKNITKLMVRYCVMMDYRANPLRILKTADYGLRGFAHNTVCKPRSATISTSLITWEKQLHWVLLTASSVTTSIQLSSYKE